MLPMTSTISPSTAAALVAKSLCSGLPAAAILNITAITTSAISTSTPAILALTVTR